MAIALAIAPSAADAACTFGANQFTPIFDSASGLIRYCNGTTTTTATLASSSISAGGSNTQVQFNNSGALGGAANLTWDNGTSTLTVTGTISVSTLTGSFTLATANIAASAVTNAKLANMNALTIKGNSTGSSAAPSDLTATTVTAMLNAFTGDGGSGGTKGLVPAPSAGDAAANKYLKADGTWTAVSAGAAAAGSTGQVQFYDSGNLGADSNLTWNNTAKALGIGGSPAASSALDITSTTKGFLPPRMSTAQRNAITSPATGLMVYDTTLSVYMYYSGSAWVSVGGGLSTGAIVAFEASSCPSGYSEYTAARGRFLRGIDNGAGNDPSGTRAAGNTQADDYKSHTHTTSVPRTPTGSSGALAAVLFDNIYGSNTANAGVVTVNASGGTETRPKNVAVIFCTYSGGGTTGTLLLSALGDVSISSPSTGQVLSYNGTAWVNSASGASKWTAGSGLIYYNSGIVGIGTTSPDTVLDVERTSTTASQIRFAATTSGGGYLTSVAANQAVFSAGAEYDGTNWVARSTTAQAINLSSAGTIGFNVNSGLTSGNTFTPTTRMTIDGSGNMGLGTASPLNSAGYTSLSINNATTSGILELQGGGTQRMALYYDGTVSRIRASGASGILVFDTNSSERMRIDASGNVSIGTTSTFGKVRVYNTAASPSIYVQNAGGGNYAINAEADGNYAIYARTTSSTYGGVIGYSASGSQYGILGYANTNSFYGSGTLYNSGHIQIANGGIYNAAGLNSYGTGSLCYSSQGQQFSGYFSFGACSSDRRLKENIEYMADGALEQVLKLKPARYTLKKDPSHNVKAGFIAQDTMDLLPEAVGKNSDGYYSWDSNAVLSYAIKAIQEMHANDNDLKAENATLRADIEALKKELNSLRENVRANNR